MLIVVGELPWILGTDIRRDGGGDDTGSAALLYCLLPQCRDRCGSEDHSPLQVLALKVSWTARADVDERRVNSSGGCGERVDAQGHTIALARQDHFSGVGKRHRSDLIIPATAAAGKLLDADLQSRGPQALMDAID